MSYKLDIMPLVALLNTIHTDCISVCCVTGVAPVKIVHGIAGVTGNLVQALTSAHSFLYGILIVHDFVVFHRDIDTRGEKQPSKSVIEYLIAF